MDKSWLPSKKLVLSFGVMAIMLLGVFFVSKIGKNNDNYFENKDLVVSDLLRNKIIEKDTDGDGLMD
ncbi:MAG: hypothetical protein PHX25_01270, partial [Candidatus Pacebacteria bacterium]|nr:hypothetical protein [Candidatus Paceibacterota bacterium]